MRCGSRAQAGLVASARPFENGLALALGEKSAHGRHIAHLDGVAVEARQDAVQAKHVAVLGERAPPVEVAAVRLACDGAAEPLEVALDGGVQQTL